MREVVVTTRGCGTRGNAGTDAGSDGDALQDQVGVAQPEVVAVE